MADPSNSIRRSLVTFPQKASGNNSAAGSSASQLPAIGSAGSLNSHAGGARSNQARQSVFGLNTAHHRQQQQQQQQPSHSVWPNREHQQPNTQHQQGLAQHHAFSSDSGRDGGAMPLIGSSAVIGGSAVRSLAGMPTQSGDGGVKRASGYFSTTSGSRPSASDETVGSSSSSAVYDAAANASAAASSGGTRSGRQVKRPKFADEVVNTDPSFARANTFGVNVSGAEQRGVNKTRKASGSHSKKARLHNDPYGYDSPLTAQMQYDELGNAISPASPATSASTSSLPSGGPLPALTNEASQSAHADDTRLPINSKSRIFSTGSNQPYSAGINVSAPPPKVSSTVHAAQPVTARSVGEYRATALPQSPAAFPEDDVFSPPPAPRSLFSNNRRQAEEMLANPYAAGSSMTFGGRRGSAEPPQQFVVLKPPEKLLHPSTDDYDDLHGGADYRHCDQQPLLESGGVEGGENKTKRKYVRKMRRPELELDEAFASEPSAFGDASFSHNSTFNDLDAATEASGSVMTGTGGGTGKKRGNGRKSSKTPSGRQITPGTSNGGGVKKKSKTGSAALVSQASSVHPSRKISDKVAATSCMKELILLKVQRDELLKLISASKDDLKPNTLKKLQKLMSKLGELAAYTVGAWKPIDDLRLIHGVEQLNDLNAVHRLIKFTCHFSLIDVQERWHALLYDESMAKLAFQAVQELPLTQLLLVQREKYMTPIELEMLRRIVPAEKPYAVEFFDRVLAENREVFLACRTGHDLMREWQTLQKLEQLPLSSDDAGAHVPAPGGVPIYRLERQAVDDALEQLGGGAVTSSSATEATNAEGTAAAESVPEPSSSSSSKSNPLFLQTKGAVHDMMERATQHMKHRIRTLEFELPRLKVLLEYMTGVQTSSFDPDYPEMCLAVLRGKMARFLILRPEVNFGRSCPGFEPDINLSYEGPATKISRQHGRIVLDISGRFAITNEGNRPFLVDDLAVLRGEYCFLNDYSVVEICGLTLVFYVNKTEVAKQLKKRVKKDHDDLMSAVATAHGLDVAAATTTMRSGRTAANEKSVNATVSGSLPSSGPPPSKSDQETLREHPGFGE